MYLSTVSFRRREAQELRKKKKEFAKHDHSLIALDASDETLIDNYQFKGLLYLSTSIYSPEIR